MGWRWICSSIPNSTRRSCNWRKQQDATGIVRRNDDESEIAGREAAKLVYGADSPYTRQPELATIGAVTLTDLNAWHDRSLEGKLIIAVSGDFDPAAMEAKLRATFEPLPEVSPLPAHHEVFHDPTQAVYFINKEDVNQSNIEIMGLGTDRHNPDIPIARRHERDSRRRLRQPALPEGAHRTRTCVRRRRRARLRL